MPGSEHRSPQQYLPPLPATSGLAADGGGGGRGCSRRVSRVTTPMKFPIVGGGDEAAVAAPPFSSSAAPPRRSHLMSFPVDPPGGLPVESVGVGAPKPPACPPNNTPLPAPRGSGRGEGREALQRPFYV